MPDQSMKLLDINKSRPFEGSPKKKANMFYHMHRPRSINQAKRPGKPFEKEQDFKPSEPVKLEKVEQVTLFS